MSAVADARLRGRGGLPRDSCAEICARLNSSAGMLSPKPSAGLRCLPFASAELTTSGSQEESSSIPSGNRMRDGRIGMDSECVVKMRMALRAAQRVFRKRSRARKFRKQTPRARRGHARGVNAFGSVARDQITFVLPGMARGYVPSGPGFSAISASHARFFGKMVSSLFSAFSISISTPL